MSQNIPPKLMTKFEEHQRIAQNPMPLGSWLELQKQNSVTATLIRNTRLRNDAKKIINKRKKDEKKNNHKNKLKS